MSSTAPFAAILVAAGGSQRMGSDKLWTDFWGRPTWRWAFDALLATPGLVRIAIMVPPDGIDRFAAALPEAADDRCLIVAGGDARADSVIAGLWALTGAGHDDGTLVLVHDAARPAVSAELIQTIVAAAAEGPERAVVPVVPIVDSLKRVKGGRVVAPVEREEVAAAQTPQAARLGALRAAIEESHAWGRPVTDDAGALAAAGVPVHTVPGDPANRKLTEPGRHRPDARHPGGTRCRIDGDRAAARRASWRRLRRPSARRRTPDAAWWADLGRGATRPGRPLRRRRRASRADRRAARRRPAGRCRDTLPVRRGGMGGSRFGGSAGHGGDPAWRRMAGDPPRWTWSLRRRGPWSPRAATSSPREWRTC